MDMMDSKSTNLQHVLDTLPDGVQLIAVSKTKPIEAVMELYNAGQRHFGENRVQELVDKYDVLPKDIQWHLIGHLQTNKVKYIAPFVSMIHSIDSFKLLKEVNKQAGKHNRVVDCLLQFHVAEESSKFGLDIRRAREILLDKSFVDMKHVRICGVMGMATFTEDENQIKKEFSELYRIFSDLKWEFFSIADHFKEVSMGMSGDYKMAIDEGSTMVRIGSLLFGPR